jgi:toxin ParE1/3/4
MTKFVLTNKAVEDITNIWNYTFDKWSEQQADKYYKMLLSNCQDIVDNPNLGKNYNGIKKELFGLKANRHIIFYRNIKDKPIEITRILHGRMDLKRRITE